MESGIATSQIRAVARESAVVIELRTGRHIWIAAGNTDLRRGFQGLTTLIDTVLEQAPYSGHVFVFRGKRGDLIKRLWWDGDGTAFVSEAI